MITQAQIPSDSYPTGKDNLQITVLGHGSLLFEYKNYLIYVDPCTEVTDLSKLPKADLILITHEHRDHLDKPAIDIIKMNKTKFITSKAAAEMLGYGKSLNNGEKTSFHGISIQAVPAYNIIFQKSPGVFFHPKGRGNGYILTFDNLKIYIAGDTEFIPEMNDLKGKINIAFLPKNQPYTMDDEMFIDAVHAIQPTIAYPYHMSEFDENKIIPALKDINTKVVLRPMKNI